MIRRRKRRSPMWIIERGALASFMTLLVAAPLAIVMSEVGQAVLHAMDLDMLMQVMRT